MPVQVQVCIHPHRYFSAATDKTVVDVSDQARTYVTMADHGAVAHRLRQLELEEHIDIAMRYGSFSIRYENNRYPTKEATETLFARVASILEELRREFVGAGHL